MSKLSRRPEFALAAAVAALFPVTALPGGPDKEALREYVVCDQRFAIVVFRVEGAEGALPAGWTAETREVESGALIGEGVRDLGAGGAVMLGDDSMRERLAGGELELVTTLRRGESTREVRHRLGLGADGCHVVLKAGPARVVLEE